MSSFDRILPYKNAALWKGVGLGVAVCVLLLAFAIPNMFPMGKKSVRLRQPAYFALAPSDAHTTKLQGYFGAPEGDRNVVQADGPKVIHKAQLDLLVGNCAEVQKKIEALARAESGMVESSTVEEHSARISLRIPSARFEEVRAKLRDLAVRIKQDSVAAADVSKQYFDGESRLRNLRVEEQQFLEVMKKSHTVPDILAVTKSLSEVRDEIERADAEFRHLRDQIDMAQIDVNLSSESSSGVHWAPGSSTKSAFNDFLQSLADFGDFLIWLVVNLPLIALWIVTVFFLAAASWYVLRKAVRLLRALFGNKAVAPVLSSKQD